MTMALFIVPATVAASSTLAVATTGIVWLIGAASAHTFPSVQDCLVFEISCGITSIVSLYLATMSAAFLLNAERYISNNENRNKSFLTKEFWLFATANTLLSSAAIGMQFVLPEAIESALLNQLAMLFFNLLPVAISCAATLAYSTFSDNRAGETDLSEIAGEKIRQTLDFTTRLDPIEGLIK